MPRQRSLRSDTVTALGCMQNGRAGWDPIVVAACVWPCRWGSDAIVEIEAGALPGFRRYCTMFLLADCLLANGSTRWHAHSARQHETIPADVRNGDWLDALRYSLSANAFTVCQAAERERDQQIAERPRAKARVRSAKRSTSITERSSSASIAVVQICSL